MSRYDSIISKLSRTLRKCTQRRIALPILYRACDRLCTKRPRINEDTVITSPSFGNWWTSFIRPCQFSRLSPTLLHKRSNIHGRKIPLFSRWYVKSEPWTFFLTLRFQSHARTFLPWNSKPTVFNRVGQKQLLVIPQRKHNLSYLQGDHFFTGTIAPLPRGRDARWAP